MIELITGELLTLSATGNDMILDSYVKIRMQYVVYDPDHDAGYETRGTMGVNLTANGKDGGCGPRIPV